MLELIELDTLRGEVSCIDVIIGGTSVVKLLSVELPLGDGSVRVAGKILTLSVNTVTQQSCSDVALSKRDNRIISGYFLKHRRARLCNSAFVVNIG